MGCHATGPRWVPAPNLIRQSHATRIPCMTIESWLQSALADADRRKLPELKPLLEALALATRVLRDADFNEDASRVK